MPGPIDIVLLNPPVTLGERYGALAAGGSKLPPLGLAGLAAVAREAGHTVALVDAECLGMDAAAAADAVLALEPRVVGVTAVTMTVHAAASVAALVKARSPKALTVLGGPHATALPEATLGAFPAFDVVAIGEADDTLPGLLGAFLRESGPLESVAGLAVRTPAGAPVRTPPRAPVEDLDRLPLPAWDLLPDIATAYRPPLNAVRRLPAGAIITSRGCAGRCTFCDRSVTGRRVRFHSPGYVMRAVTELAVRYGLRDIHFHDDNLLAGRRRLLELCDLLAASGLDLTWSAEGRVDMVAPDVLAAMRRAGCWQIGYGIESGSQAQLDRLCKGITLEEIDAAVRMTRAAGIESRGFFMAGAPGETPETLAATSRLIASLPLDDMLVQTFDPHPGTEIAAGLPVDFSDPKEWGAASRWSGGFVPEGLTADDLSRFQRAAFRAFYLKPRVVARYARRLFGSAALARELLRGLAAWACFTLRPARAASRTRGRSAPRG